MSQSIERQLVDEDYQRIEANQLGIPLGVYRLKPGYIRLFHWGGLLTFVISAALLITVIITSFLKDLQFSVLFSPLVIVVSGLLGGWFFCASEPRKFGACMLSSANMVCSSSKEYSGRMMSKLCTGRIFWHSGSCLPVKTMSSPVKEGRHSPFPISTRIATSWSHSSGNVAGWHDGEYPALYLTR